MQDAIEYCFAMIAFLASVYMATGNGWAVSAAFFLMVFIIGTVRSLKGNFIS